MTSCLSRMTSCLLLQTSTTRLSLKDLVDYTHLMLLLELYYWKYIVISLFLITFNIYGILKTFKRDYTLLNIFILKMN